MKNVYLAAAIIGFLFPNSLVFIESIETGNYLLYADIPATIRQMFANRISTIFSIDLLFGVLVFLVWTFQESKTYQLPKIWIIWSITFLFGFASGFPLFLYWKAYHIKAE